MIFVKSFLKSISKILNIYSQINIWKLIISNIISRNIFARNIYKIIFHKYISDFRNLQYISEIIFSKLFLDFEVGANLRKYLPNSKYDREIIFHISAKLKYVSLTPDNLIFLEEFKLVLVSHFAF